MLNHQMRRLDPLIAHIPRPSPSHMLSGPQPTRSNRVHPVIDIPYLRLGMNQGQRLKYLYPRPSIRERTTLEENRLFEFHPMFHTIRTIGNTILDKRLEYFRIPV